MYIKFLKCYYLITHLVCHKYPRPDEEIYYCWIRQWYFQNALFGDSCGTKVGIIAEKITQSG